MKHLRTGWFQSNAKGFLLWLLLTPFLLTQLVASGTMPNFGAEGLELVLCTTEGPTTIILGTDGNPIPENTGETSTMTSCPWSAGSEIFLGHIATVGHDFTHALNQADPFPVPTFRASNLLTHLPPTRGPPVTI